MVPFMVLLIGLGIRERLWFPMLISPLVVFSAAELLIVTALLPNGGGVPDPYSRAFELYRAGIPFRDPCFAFGCAPNGGWLSFTWGELIGLPSHLQLAPVFVFWAISFVLLFLCAVKLDRLEITRLRAGSGICLMVLSLLAAAFIPAFYH